jgi:hypothetical protein
MPGERERRSDALPVVAVAVAQRFEVPLARRQQLKLLVAGMRRAAGLNVGAAVDV